MTPIRSTLITPKVSTLMTAIRNNMSPLRKNKSPLKVNSGNNKNNRGNSALILKNRLSDANFAVQDNIRKSYGANDTGNDTGGFMS
jgi:hypothetical protein